MGEIKTIKNLLLIVFSFLFFVNFVLAEEINYNKGGLNTVSFLRSVGIDQNGDQWVNNYRLYLLYKTEENGSEQSTYVDLGTCGTLYSHCESSSYIAGNQNCTFTFYDPLPQDAILTGVYADVDFGNQRWSNADEIYLNSIYIGEFGGTTSSYCTDDTITPSLVYRGTLPSVPENQTILYIKDMEDIIENCIFNTTSRTYYCNAEYIYVAGNVQLLNDYLPARNIVFNAKEFRINKYASLNADGGSSYDVRIRGGGSGGGIVINAENVSICGLLTANGGNGYSFYHGWNMYNGKGGKIKINSDIISSCDGTLATNGGNSAWSAGGTGGEIDITAYVLDVSGSIYARGGIGRLEGAVGVINLNYSCYINLTGSDISPSSSVNEIPREEIICNTFLPFISLLRTDIDEDGLKYTCDNCPTRYNPEQLDANFNGIGDICEIADDVPPSTMIIISGTVGLGEWYTSSVEVTLNATDNEGGSGVAKTEYSFDGTNWNMYTAPFTITNEGTTTIYYRSTDNADNVEETKTQEVKIDKTAPTITASRTPAPNANGWNNEDVTVHFDCSDSLSGIDSVTGDQVISTEGAGQFREGTCTDKAGNSASTTVGNINIDKTPPSITINTPTPYSLYTVGMALDFSASDLLSGVAAVSGSLTNTAGESQNVTSGFTPAPGVYTLVVSAADNAGNLAESEPVFFVVYDPEGGFATGGGWFYPDSESTLPGGRANFGFVAKYKNSASTGNLEFQYKDAGINLKSTTIDWLVISGVSAQFQGTGTINGAGLYTFRVLAKDNAEPGAGADHFDIRIWEGTDTGAGIYHKAKNTLAGGNIVVHKK